VEACLASRPHNGGLMSLRELHAAVSRRRGSAAAPVSEDDLLRAIAQLRVLGGGWDLLTVGGPTQRFVRSVPTELNGDQTALLARAAAAGGVLTAAGAARDAGWAPRRVSDALEALLKARACVSARFCSARFALNLLLTPSGMRAPAFCLCVARARRRGWRWWMTATRMACAATGFSPSPPARRRARSREGRRQQLLRHRQHKAACAASRKRREEQTSFSTCMPSSDGIGGARSELASHRWRRLEQLVCCTKRFTTGAQLRVLHLSMTQLSVRHMQALLAACPLLAWLHAGDVRIVKDEDAPVAAAKLFADMALHARLRAVALPSALLRKST
jgi:hypothetical protein